MRRLSKQQAGGPEALGLVEAPVPEPGPGELLIRIETVGVDLPGLRFLHRTPAPVSPGGEFAGRVVGLGPGVAGPAVGRRVAGVAFSGVFAEYAAVPAALCTPIPDGVGPAVAMTVARGGLVALGALHTSRLAPGEAALITAAAGGVGHLAVQLARARGAARVVAAVGAREKADFVRGLGADEVITYQEAEWGTPVDVAVEGVGGEVLARAVATLAPFGRLVSYSAAGGTLDAAALLGEMRSVTGFAVGRLVREQPELLDRLRAELWTLTTSGRLRPVIHAEYPLERAADAYGAVASRANLGRVAVRVA